MVCFRRRSLSDTAAAGGRRSRRWSRRRSRRWTWRGRRRSRRSRRGRRWSRRRRGIYSHLQQRTQR
jgi:hypothetical protein